MNERKKDKKLQFPSLSFSAKVLNSFETKEIGERRGRRRREERKEKEKERPARARTTEFKPFWRQTIQL
jgi:hypothetical protein